MTEARKQRLCDVCWQLDAHPRVVVHVAAGTPGAVPTAEDLAALDERYPNGVPAQALAEILEPTTLVRHHDCAVAASGQSATAGEIADKARAILEAVGGAHGDDLTAALEGGASDHLSDSNPEA